MTPSPDHYQKSTELMGKNKRFFASKLERNTEIDMIFKKKNTSPSPFSYDPKEPKSRRNVFSSKLDRDGFIEDAKARANDSPPPYDVNFTTVRERLRGRTFYPMKKDNLEPIKKKPGPDMGSYTADKAFNKIIKRVKVASFSKYNIPLVMDAKVKQKKWVPGAGTYQWEKSFEKTTKHPFFKKGKF